MGIEKKGVKIEQTIPKFLYSFGYRRDFFTCDFS